MKYGRCPATVIKKLKSYKPGLLRESSIKKTVSRGGKMKKLIAILILIPEISLHALKAVVLMPSHAEIACALGAGQDIAAVGSYCDWPAELAQKPKVGDYFKPDLEKIYSIKPDFVLLSFSANSNTAADMRKLGLKVVELPPERDLSGLYSNTISIAELFGRKKQGEILIKKIKKDLPTSQRKKLKKVFFEIDSGFWTAGRDSFLNALLKKAGGENVFAVRSESYFKVSWESLLAANPDVIISNYSQPDFFMKLPLAEKVSAVKNKKVFKLPPYLRDMLVRPGPRTPQAVRELAELIK